MEYNVIMYNRESNKFETILDSTESPDEALVVARKMAAKDYPVIIKRREDNRQSWRFFWAPHMEEPDYEED